MTTHTQLYLNDMRTTLTLLEKELINLGWWQSISDKPNAEALASMEPFCIDTLTFTQWLQWVYIPKMHAYMNQTGQLPNKSSLLPIAEEAWKNTTVDTTRLMEIITILDTIIHGKHQILLQRLLSLH